MIVYDLRCDTGHQFEGWFSHADDYVQQKAQGLLACPVCSSVDVHKRPSASHVHTQVPSADASERPHTGQHTPANALEALRRYVGENFADVGAAFPEEARKIHYGETEPRSIRGEATREEFHALREEGIEVHALPLTLDKRRLN